MMMRETEHFEVEWLDMLENNTLEEKFAAYFFRDRCLAWRQMVSLLTRALVMQTETE